jgi:two-component system nitrogen regulation response regulator NtrX
MKKILIADDDSGIQTVLRQILLDKGYTVDIVNSGKAVYLLAGMNYDLMIVDIYMPEWSGLEGLEMARIFGSKSPVIVLTGNIDQLTTEDRKNIVLLEKPFKVDLFVETVEKIIKGNENVEKREL